MKQTIAKLEDHKECFHERIEYLEAKVKDRETELSQTRQMQSSFANTASRSNHSRDAGSKVRARKFEDLDDFEFEHGPES